MASRVTRQDNNKATIIAPSAVTKCCVADAPACMQVA